MKLSTTPIVQVGIEARQDFLIQTKPLKEPAIQIQIFLGHIKPNIFNFFPCDFFGLQNSPTAHTQK